MASLGITCVTTSESHAHQIMSRVVAFIRSDRPDAEMVDYSGDGVSRLGPWGGLVSLTPNSLLAGSGGTQAATGFPASGVALTLNGGMVLPLPSKTIINIEAAN